MKSFSIYMMISILLLSVFVNHKSYAAVNDVGVDLIPICKDSFDNSLQLGLFVFNIHKIDTNFIDSLVLEIKEPIETLGVSTLFYEGTVFYRPIISKRQGNHLITTTLYEMKIGQLTSEVAMLGQSLILKEMIDHQLSYDVDIKIVGKEATVLEFKNLPLDISVDEIIECNSDPDYLSKINDEDYIGLYYKDRDKVRTGWDTQPMASTEKCYIESSDDENLAISRFLDISSDAESWIKKSVGRLKKCDVVIGYEDGTFKPFTNISRAELTKMVINMANTRKRVFPDSSGSNIPFNDVESGTWWHAYITTAYHHNVISGYEDNTFRPFNTISRQEALKIILGVFDFDIAEESYLGLGSFTDVTTGHWSEKYIEFAKDKNIISGYEDQTFKPLDLITRAEISKILINIVDILDRSEQDSN
jgi:hypothetical protein